MRKTKWLSSVTVGTTVLLAVVLATGVGTAGISFKLDYLMSGPLSSESGTNTLAIPYNPTIPDVGASGLTASDLADDLGSSVDCVLRFDRTTDKYIRHEVASPLPAACEDNIAQGREDEDFGLTPGEGYRVVLNADKTYRLTGTPDTSADIDLLSSGETVEGGTSNSGFSNFAAPYNISADKASKIRDEINNVNCPLGTVCNQIDCPGGSCASASCPGGGTCNEYNLCDGGDNDGENCRRCSGGSKDGKSCTRCSDVVETTCNRAFTQINRFLTSSDTLSVYTGSPPSGQSCTGSPPPTFCDFDLVPGESYQIQVSNHVDWSPRQFDAQVVVESIAPAPCGVVGGVIDGGYVRIRNPDPGSSDVRVVWHGGDTTTDGAPPYTNLVFLPDIPGVDDTIDPRQCVNQGGACVSACPTPGEPAGCEEIVCSDPNSQTECGCELEDGLQGVCKGGTTEEYHRCLTLDDCPVGKGFTTCRRLDVVGQSCSGCITDTFGIEQAFGCNQATCDETQAEAEANCGYTRRSNCCDNDVDITENPEDCDDPTKVFCTVWWPFHPDNPNLGTEAQPQFLLEEASTDGGVTWFDPTTRGIEKEVPFSHTNCCDFVCVGQGSSSCNSCNADPDSCPTGEQCVSRCTGTCVGGFGDGNACEADQDCTGGDCISVCD